MNKKLTLLAFSIILTINIAIADIIPEDQHYVLCCAKITNISDFNDLTMISRFQVQWDPITIKYINANSCISQPDYGSTVVYAINSKYLDGKNISDLDLPSDKNALPANINIAMASGYIPDSIPIESITNYYEILGFTEINVILHQYKKITTYNDGQENLVENFDYTGDSTSLFKQIPLDFFENQTERPVSIFPNPTHAFVNIELKTISKSINIQAYSVEGKKVLSQNLNSSSNSKFHKINVSHLPAGIYIFEVSTSKATEIQRIVIK